MTKQRRPRRDGKRYVSVHAKCEGCGARVERTIDLKNLSPTDSSIEPILCADCEHDLDECHDFEARWMERAERRIVTTREAMTVMYLTGECPAAE